MAVPPNVEDYRVSDEPYYAPQGHEIELFEAAHRNTIPVSLKGPTGCGKTRFMEHIAWRHCRPLVTVSCHGDLTASDLVGRYFIVGGETTWIDGPLAYAVRNAKIDYFGPKLIGHGFCSGSPDSIRHDIGIFYDDRAQNGPGKMHLRRNACTADY